MKEGRTRRVAEEVKREIAGLLTKELKDPRIGFVSVMEVRMSPDLKHANVYVSLFGSDPQRKGSLAGLRSSAGWMRRVVTKNLRLRFAPEIRFFEDKTLEDVFHLENLFKEIHAAEGGPDAETTATGDDDGPAGGGADGNGQH